MACLQWASLSRFGGWKLEIGVQHGLARVTDTAVCCALTWQEGAPWVSFIRAPAPFMKAAPHDLVTPEALPPATLALRIRIATCIGRTQTFRPLLRPRAVGRLFLPVCDRIPNNAPLGWVLSKQVWNRDGPSCRAVVKARCHLEPEARALILGEPRAQA